MFGEVESVSLVREFYHSQWFLIVMITLAIWIFVSTETITLYTMKQAHGDDTESELGLCLRGWTARCPETKLQHDLEGRLMIWNSLNCSVRDICNPVNCDPNDESFNVTGFCDPDWNDSGIEDKPVSEGWACFDTKALADKFLKVPGNEGWNVTVPCPKSIKINPSQEDESGK